MAGAAATIIWFLPALAFINESSGGVWHLLISLAINILNFLVINGALILQAVITRTLCQRRTGQFSIPGMVLVLQSFIAGAISGAIAHLYIDWPVKDSSSLLVRTLQPGLLAATWIPLTLITVNRLNHLRRKRAALEGELEILVQIEQTASGVLDEIRTIFEQSIRDSLKLTAAHAQQKLTQVFPTQGQSSEELPELIRDIATIDMRDLSQAMIRGEGKPPIPVKNNGTDIHQKSHRYTSIMQCLRDFSRPDKLWLVVFLMVATFYQGMIGLLPFSKELELFCILSVGLTLILWLFKRIYQRYDFLFFWLLFLRIPTLALFNFIVITHYFPEAGLQRFEALWDNRVFLIFSITFFCLAAKFCLLYTLNQSQVAFQKLNYEAALRKAEHSLHHREFVALSLKWATHIHGRVQSQLLVAAQKLDFALGRVDLVSFNQALFEVKVLLGTPDQELHHSRATLHDELAHRAHLWHGLVDITGEITPWVGLISPEKIRIIGEVAEEAFANAFRHGSASVITYHSQQNEDRRLRLVVKDNGSGPKARQEFPKGIGSTIFSRASNSDFSISRDSAAELTVVELFISID